MGEVGVKVWGWGKVEACGKGLVLGKGWEKGWR